MGFVKHVSTWALIVTFLAALYLLQFTLSYHNINYGTLLEVVTPILIYASLLNGGHLLKERICSYILSPVEANSFF